MSAPPAMQARETLRFGEIRIAGHDVGDEGAAALRRGRGEDPRQSRRPVHDRAPPTESAAKRASSPTSLSPRPDTLISTTSSAVSEPASFLA